VKGDILIDDDPAEIKYMKTIKKTGILISPFRKGKEPPPGELDSIYSQINRSKSKFKFF